MKIHVIRTRTVAIKRRQVEGVGHGARPRLLTFVNREWTGPLPIYKVAIEHPDGVIVIDTGDTARASEPGYFPHGTHTSGSARRASCRPSSRRC